MFLSEIILLVILNSVLFVFVLSLSTIIMSLQSSCPWSAIASTLSITSFYFISNVSFKSEIFDSEYLKKKKKCSGSVPFCTVHNLANPSKDFTLLLYYLIGARSY